MRNDTNGTNKKAVGLGIAALAAAAAGAYYLYGSDKAARNRRKVKSWMLRMKAEVMDKIEDAKDLTKDGYDKVIDSVSEKYRALKDVDEEEVSELADRMRSHWNDLEDDLKEMAGVAKKQVKKASKAK